MSTVLDIISGALTLLGQLGQGQTANAEDGALGFAELNLLLSQASTKRLMLASVTQRQYALQANVADYTIGPTGATFAAARPTFIESAQINVPGSSVWLPVSILDKQKWDALANRAAVDEIVTSVYPEYSYPNLTFHVHPKPSGTPSIRFGAWEQLTQFTSLFDVIAYPPAYEEWMKSNLAILLAPSYDQPVPQDLLQRAAKAEVSVMGINAQGLGGSLSAIGQFSSPNVGQPIPTQGAQ